MVDYKNSTVTRGPYSDILSIYDSIARKPQALADLIRQFGDGFYIMNFLNLAERVIDITTPNLKIIEEGAPERPVTVSIAVTAANVQADLTFAAADDSDDYVREGFDLLIPSTYTNATITKPMRIYLVGSDWKGRFYDETTEIDSTITTKEFVLGASSFGYGTGQPQPMASGFYERFTSDRIMKETAGIEGGQVYQEDYEAVETANGNKGILSRATIEADFRLDSQMDSFLLTGQENTNSNLTATSGISGGTSAIPSADGMDNIMEELALALTWTTGFDITKFEAVKGLLESVGIINRTVDFFVGTGLCTSIEQNMQSYLNANSPGHSLYDMMGSAGFNIREVMKNSVKFKIMELHSFSNPNKFGAAEYDYRNNGYIFPEGEYKVKWNGGGTANEEISLPHLTLGYPVGKGENRRRTISAEYGVTNLSPTASNDLDGWKYYFMTHLIPIWVHTQQTIRVTKV